MGFEKIRPESEFILEGMERALVMSTPVNIDLSDDENIYMGYSRRNETLDKDDELLIKKVHTDGDLISTYFACGSWDDRLTLEYK